MRVSAMVVVLGCLLGAVPGMALTPYLVQQINTGGVPGDSSPTQFIAVGDYALFVADDGVNGPALWRSDGTAAGTYRLEFSCPSCGLPAVFAVVGNAVLFTEVDRSGGSTAWVTHGTSATTEELLPSFDFSLYPGFYGDYYVSQEVAQQGLTYFAGDKDTDSIQLWRSDGTPGGTFALTDFPSIGPDFQGLAAAGGELFFGASDATGPALWKTDGTVKGTRIVERFVPPPNVIDDVPFAFGPAGKELIFEWYSKASGAELWRTNGTAAGTQPLPQIVPGPGSPAILGTQVLGARLLLAADDGHAANLWETDGTALRRLTNFETHDSFEPSPFVFSGVTLGATTFLSADDGVHGAELWATDGTAAGTRMVSDVCPGSCSSSAEPNAVLDGRLLFSADDGVHGAELWSTDGTAAGTHMLADACPGACGSHPYVQAVVGSRALFLAENAQSVYQLWRTNGTAAGTFQLTAFNAPNFTLTGDNAAVGGVLLFQGTDPEHGNELWASDGTRPGTHLLVDINPSEVPDGSDPTGLQAAAGKVYFFATDGGSDGVQLWVSDGTAAGTFAVSDPADGVYGDTASVAVGQSFFFIGSDDQGIGALWTSDGSPGGLVRLTPASLDVDSTGIAAVGGTLFFDADDGVHGGALWKSDGTAAGTVPVDSVNWTGGGAQTLTPFGSRLFYFLAAANSEELWSTDGTLAGTERVAILNAPIGDNLPLLLTAFGGRLYFFAFDAPQETGLMRLWSTDGTPGGTQAAVSFNQTPGGPPFAPQGLSVAGSQLFIFTASGLWAGNGTDAGTSLVSSTAFLASFDQTFAPTAAIGQKLAFLTGATSANLWLSDGTAAGTAPLTDPSGKPLPAAQAVVAVGNMIAFATNTTDPTATYGDALWQSDGTAAGTSQILASGVGGEVLEPLVPELVAAGQRLFFRAYNSTTGDQLWAAQP